MAARDDKKRGKRGVKYPLYYPPIHPLCPAAVLVDINAHGGERSETMKRAISTAALPPRRSVRPAAPARAVSPAGLGRSLCAPRSGSECAPKARRFLAQYALIVRATRAHYARLRRVWAQKTPAGSARVFCCGRVDLPGSLKNGFQTPPDCPQIAF